MTDHFVHECRTCIHRREGLLASDDYECRRYPPTAISAAEIYSKTVWPKVKPTDWCGEWKRDPEAK